MSSIEPNTTLRPKNTQGSFQFDLVVVGGGSAGVRAARIAAQNGAKVALCEGRDIGGTCVLRGCVPKKLIHFAADIGHTFQISSAYGWQTPSPGFDWGILRDHVQAETKRLSQIYTKNLENHGVHLFSEHATLVDQHTLELESTRLSARYILIATGGKPSALNVPGNQYTMTSDDIFHLDALPKSLTIIGSGYIACEFASILCHFGIQINMVIRGHHVLRGFDVDLRSRATDHLENKKINLLKSSQVQKISQTSYNSKAVHLQTGEILESELVLNATGRTPNTESLGLGKLGIQCTPEGAIHVNEYLQTNHQNIYAVGDVTNRVNLTPVAILEGQMVANNLFGQNPQKRPINDHWIPKAVFTLPPMASVGCDADTAYKNRISHLIFDNEFKPMQTGFAGLSSKTYLKMIVNADDDQILGLHMIGPNAPELIQCLTPMVHSGMTKQQFDQTIPLHPTLAEEWLFLKPTPNTHG